MKYNKRNIKPFKGRLILMHVKTPKNEFTLTGEITANTEEHILFNVNKDKTEISLKYDQVIEITEPEKG